jgi:hypothetical protein
MGNGAGCGKNGNVWWSNVADKFRENGSVKVNTREKKVKNAGPLHWFKTVENK